MINYSLHPLDLLVIALYVIIVIYIGIYFAKKHVGANDYFLGGRSFTWPFVGLSLFASNMSSSSLVGMAGSAYGTGISVFNYEWMAAVVLVFFSIFFLPFLLQSQVYTLPEFLEKRYDSRARVYFSILTIFMTIIIDTSATLYAGALSISLIFPHIPIWQLMLGLAIITGFYTMLGGLSSVIITDAIQAFLLTLGSVIVTGAAFLKIESWNAVRAVTPPEMLKLFMPLDDPFLPWLGVVLGVPILGFYFWCTNQFIVQRVLAAKSVDHGRWGSLFAGFLKIIPIFIMVLPGTMARLLYPGLERPDLAFPTMVFDLLPIGVKGIVIAAFLAAIMSSLDSTLNSAATLLTMDFYKKFKPETADKTLMNVGRVFTVIFMLLAVIWAPNILKFPSLWEYLQSVLAYASPPIVALYLVGLFWKNANSAGAFAGIVFGFVFGIGQLIAKFAGMDLGIFSRIHFLYMAFILMIATALIIVLFSAFSGKKDKQDVTQLIWTRKFFHDETKLLQNVIWYQNYRIISVFLLVFTAIVVYVFA